jgi:hypothetical protein
MNRRHHHHHRKQGAGLNQRAMSSGGGFIKRASSSPGRPHSSHPEALRLTSRVRERLGGTAVLRLARLLALIATALLALAASSASAATVRPYQSQITEADGPVLTDPTGLAVDSADNLWVSDTGTHLVSKSESVAVNDHIYVADNLDLVLA